jgi:RNA polymerase sigma factor (sigma-70 family)
VVRAELRGELIDALIIRTVQGDMDAWHALWTEFAPTVSAVAATWRRGNRRFSRDVDERRNIVVRVMGELRADGFRRLRLYLASADRRGQGSFRAWLVTVAARSAISYYRAQARGHLCAEHASERPARRLDSLEEISGIEARDVLEKARRHLTEAQLAALFLWLEGWDHGEIAERLHLDDGASADRLVRAGLWRLRDRLCRRDGVRVGDAAAKKIGMGA